MQSFDIIIFGVVSSYLSEADFYSFNFIIGPKDNIQFFVDHFRIHVPKLYHPGFIPKNSFETYKYYSKNNINNQRLYDHLLDAKYSFKYLVKIKKNRDPLLEVKIKSDHNLWILFNNIFQDRRHSYAQHRAYNSRGRNRDRYSDKEYKYFHLHRFV